jgi:hypothetical protein
VQYNQPYGVSDPNAAYIDGNPSTGQMGSIPPAASIEYPQREIVNLIADANAFAPSNTDLHQLGRAIQSGRILYGVDTGATNVLQMNLSPPPLAYYDGMLVGCKAANTNTSAAAMNINALGARPIVRIDGTPTVPGDIPQGSQWLYRYDATNNRWVILTGVGSSVRPPLQQPMDLYVNVATGSDTALDGSQAAVSGGKGPFQTIQHAFTVAWKYSPGPYGVTIHVAPGNYPNVISTPTYAGPVVTLRGAGVTQTFLTGQNDQDTCVCSGANTLVVDQVHVATGTGVGPPSGLVAANGGLLIAQAINGGNAASALYEAYGGYLSINGPHIQDAGTSCGAALIESMFAGQTTIAPGTHFTFNGAFTVGQFVSASGLGVIISDTQVNGPPVFTNPGNVVGSKFTCSQNGVCTVVGQGINLFPGNSPGTTNTGGQYG